MPTFIGFYVTMRDAKRVGWLLGPFDTHEQALAQVDTAKPLAEAVDPRAAFYLFGTARRESTSDFGLPLGALNARANIDGLQVSR